MPTPDVELVSVNVFDAIANLLEPGQREYFYQRMLYFRHLRSEDELLRIVEAMGFLALIIRESPNAIAGEREHFATMLAESAGSILAATEATRTYQKQLDDRLTDLPTEIAQGLDPKAVAREITESLRQQFTKTGLPATANALAMLSKRFAAESADLQRAAEQLKASVAVTEQARRAIADISAEVANATENAGREMANLSRHFSVDYKYSIATMCSAALLLCVLLGYALENWRVARFQGELPVIAPPTVESIPLPAPPSPKPSSKKRTPNTTGRE